MNWFDEGKDTLTRRVKQIRTGVHWAEQPPSRICHMVSNVQILEHRPDEVAVKSRFLLYRNRVETETDFLVGKREDPAAARRRSVADRPAQDHPRPERAPRQEPDLLLLK